MEMTVFLKNSSSEILSTISNTTSFIECTLAAKASRSIRRYGYRTHFKEVLMISPYIPAYLEFCSDGVVEEWQSRAIDKAMIMGDKCRCGFSWAGT